MSVIDRPARRLLPADTSRTRVDVDVDVIHATLAPFTRTHYWRHEDLELKTHAEEACPWLPKKTEPSSRILWSSFCSCGCRDDEFFVAWLLSLITTTFAVCSHGLQRSVHPRRLEPSQLPADGRWERDRHLCAFHGTVCAR